MKEMSRPVLHYNNVLLVLASHFAPNHNEAHSRYVFRCRMQQQKAFNSFFTDAKLKGGDCNSEAERDKMVRYQIVDGTSDGKAHTNILKVDNPTLVQVVKICLARETTKSRLEAFKHETAGTDNVHGMKNERKKPPKKTSDQRN